MSVNALRRGRPLAAPCGACDSRFFNSQFPITPVQAVTIKTQTLNIIPLRVLKTGGFCDKMI